MLYGNPAAQRVLKFKDNPEKFDPENALADIMLIHRFADIQLEIEQMGRMDEGPFLRSHFITDDDGLIQILKCFILPMLSIDTLMVEKPYDYDSQIKRPTSRYTK